MTKIEIFRKFWPKSRYYANIEPKSQSFRIILTKINNYLYFDQNGHFIKFDPNQDIFRTILTQTKIFWKFLTQIDFRTYWTKLKIFLKMLTKINFTTYLWPRSRFCIILDQNREFSTNFQQNRDFFWPKPRYLRQFWPKVEIIRKFWQRKYFWTFDQYNILSKILIKSRIFRKFWPKSRYLQILTQFCHSFRDFSINIYCNFDQDRHIWSNFDREFPTILTKIEIFQIFFTKYQRFLENFDQNRELFEDID